MRDFIAVVTGSNKGIGFEIAKKLSCYARIKTIIACRNEKNGLEAVKLLGNEVEYQQLDIDDDNSIQSFTNRMMNKYNKIDILVNNAAIAFKQADPTPFHLQASPTVSTNYFGTLKLTQSLLPLIKNSQLKTICNVASEAGHLKTINHELQQKFQQSTLTISELNLMMNKFVEDVENKEHEKYGWPNSCYGISKLAVIALTKILAKENPDLFVNACCPGYCSTDMSSHKGIKTAEQGSETPVFLSTLSLRNEKISGKFYSELREIEW
jgi:carbonyl reductase 1